MNDERFERAIERFDEENARDPNVEVVDGEARPKELLYADRLTCWVFKLSPRPSRELRLAARAQHICRWTIPRESYPLDRPGYLRWRNDLKKLHANKTAELLHEVGYEAELIDKVRDLILKKNFPRDEDSRVLEDALCLVFLEFQLAELAGKTAVDKVVNALRKSWKKMTPAAREHANRLNLGENEQSLIRQALEGG